MAIRLKILDGATGSLIGLSRQLLKTHGDAGRLETKLASIGRQLLVGGALTGAGVGIFELIGKTVPAATKYADELSRLNTLGMNSTDVAKTVKAAWDTTYKVPTTTAVENLATFRELSSVLGDKNRMEGIQLLPDVGRLEGVMYGLTGKHQERVGFDFVKATEMRAPGGVSVDVLKKNADLMARTMVAFQGTLNVSDFHQAFKMGKTGTQAWSDDFAYKYLPTLMQELKTKNGGAQSAGTYLETFSRQVHGRIQKSAIPLWEAAGLISPKDVVKNKTGQFQLKPGSVKDIALAEANPFEWVIKDLKPAAEKLMRDRHLTLKSAIDGMFTDRNGAFVAYTMINKQQQFERDKSMVDSRGGLDVYQQLLKTSPSMAAMALHQQWEGILATIGYTIMPDLLKAANVLIPKLSQFTEWMQKNPSAVSGMVRGLVILGGALTAAGGVIITGAFIRSIGVIAGVFRTLASVSGIGSVLSQAPKLLRFIPMIGMAVDAVVGAVMGIGGAVVAAVGWPVIAIVAGLTALGVGVWWLWRHWETVAPKLKAAWDAVASGVGGFVSWIITQAKKLAALIPHLPGLPAPEKQTPQQRATGPGSAHGEVLGGAGTFFGQKHPQPSRFVPQATGVPQKVTVSVPVNLDGRQIAKVVATHLAEATSGPRASAVFDPAATLASSAANYSAA